MLKYYKIRGEENFRDEISRRDLEIALEWNNLAICDSHLWNFLRKFF